MGPAVGSQLRQGAAGEQALPGRAVGFAQISEAGLALLGQAGEAAAALCAGTTMDKITTTSGASAPFKSPGGNSLNSVLIKPAAITKDNLQVVLDAKWIDKATLCKDVTAGSVAGC